MAFTYLVFSFNIVNIPRSTKPLHLLLNHHRVDGTVPVQAAITRNPAYQFCIWLIRNFGFAPCNVIQEGLGFRIPRCGFRIPCLWIPDSTSTDSGFHNQQPGFWITIMAGFRIPLAGFRIPKAWIPDSTDQNYLDSGLPYIGRTRQKSATAKSKSI